MVPGVIVIGAICGEYNEAITRLIDILENPKVCNPTEKKVDFNEMRAAALEQCSRMVHHELEG